MSLGQHEHSVRLPVSPSSVQFACNGTYLALPHGRNDVGVWSLLDLTCKPLELVGHRRPVGGLCFGHREHATLLCSGEEDYVIVWHVEKARATLDTGQQVRGQIIGRSLGSVHYCAFNYDDTQVAVCIDRVVYILNAKEEKTVVILEGHTSLVNCAEFCPHYSSTLITASDDRTFKVWDISSGVLVYQSTIISSSPFISLTLSPHSHSVTLGTADGILRVFDLTDGNGFRCLQQLDVGRLLSRVKEARKNRLQAEPAGKGLMTISSRPSWQRPLENSIEQSPGGTDDETEMGATILGMLYTHATGDPRNTPTPACLSFLQHDETLVRDLLESAPLLIVVTTAAVVQLNARTLEPLSYTCLLDPVPSNSIIQEGDKVLSLVGNACMCQDPRHSDKVWCVLGSAFLSEAHILQFSHPTPEGAACLKMELASLRMPVSMTSGPGPPNPHSPRTGQGAGDSDMSAPGDGVTDSEELSVLSCSPLVPNSPLKSELVLKTKDSTPNKKPQQSLTKMGIPMKTGSLTKSGEIVDKQSLTFHSKVKSSGYMSSAPRKNMFQPHTNGNKSLRKPEPKQSRGKCTPVMKEYPMDCAAPAELKAKLDVAERPTAINCVKFSDDGQMLACALSNTSAQVFKMPLTGKGCAFAARSGVVSGVHWSHNNQWLISCSEDRSAHIWSMSLSDPVMTFNTLNNNFGTDKEGAFKEDKANPLFGRPVRFAQFYFMDKFLLLTCGNSFHLYKYHLDTTKSDIKRYLSHNRYKLVQSFQMEHAQHITAFSALNSFHSYLALCSGSDKSIEVFDLNVGRSVRVIPEAHSRAPHVIRQNEGSAYVSHPSSAYDLFVTAAASECIKLWDLRSNRCVRRYEGHCNRAQPCGLAISPCSKFIATGSEDRSAYIFDIRSGTYIHKLTGHTDTVSGVAFHPLYSQVVTATQDGKLRLFSEH